MADEELDTTSTTTVETTASTDDNFPKDNSVLDSGETVVHDKDDDGNVIGWHKQAPKEDEK